MASRRRLGVALLLDSPLRDEVDGLRRALGDPSLGRVAPHLTLVPPVNVRTSELTTALEVIRGAAARQPGALRITLGPPATFLPDNPVLFLDVGGDNERLRDLRDAVFRPPLERLLSWPWVPHVTLADGIDDDRIAAALASLDRYAGVADFDRVVVLEEGRGRFWTPLADARLGPPVIVGTGGLAVRITQGRVIDPLLLGALGEALGDDEEARSVWAGWTEPDADRDTQLTQRAQPTELEQIVLTAHRDGQLLGTAAIRRDPLGARAVVFVLPEVRGEGTGGHLLAQLESAALEAGWELPFVTGVGPARFYESRSAWIRPAQLPKEAPARAQASTPKPPARAQATTPKPPATTSKPGPATRTSPRRTGRAS